MSTISVACKLPNGLILTHGRTVMDGDKPRVDMNGRVVIEDARTVVLRGSNSRAPGGVINGYGITRDVDADWFADWVKRNRDSYGPLVCGAILALPIAEYIEGMTADAAHVRHGLEPLTERDPRATEGDLGASIETRTDGPAPASPA